MKNLIEFIKSIFAYSPEEQHRTRRYPTLRYKIANPLYKIDTYKLIKLIKNKRFEDIKNNLKTLPLGVFSFIDYNKLYNIYETGIKDFQAIANRDIDSLSKIFSFLNRKELIRIKRICDDLLKSNNHIKRRRIFNKEQAKILASQTSRYVEMNFEKLFA
ncbi:MAG: hypothetical protein AB1765_12515, partial [Candidatus Hydrogenedentota bacterium]